MKAKQQKTGGVKRRERRDAKKMEEGEVRVQQGRNETYQNPICASFNPDWKGGGVKGQGCIIDELAVCDT